MTPAESQTREAIAELVSKTGALPTVREIAQHLKLHYSTIFARVERFRIEVKKKHYDAPNKGSKLDYKQHTLKRYHGLVEKLGRPPTRNEFAEELCVSISTIKLRVRDLDLTFFDGRKGCKGGFHTDWRSDPAKVRAHEKRCAEIAKMTLFSYLSNGNEDGVRFF